MKKLFILPLGLLLFACQPQATPENNTKLTPLRSQSAFNEEEKDEPLLEDYEDKEKNYPKIPAWDIEILSENEAPGSAILNDMNFSFTQIHGWMRDSDKAGGLELWNDQLTHGPKLICEFRTHNGPGEYSFGWPLKDHNIYIRLRIPEGKMEPNPETSKFSITNFNTADSTISGTFDLYFDTDKPEFNTYALSPHGYHFASGSFNDVKIDLY